MPISKMTHLSPAVVEKKSNVPANYLNCFLNFSGRLLDELLSLRFDGDRRRLQATYTAFKYKDIDLYVVFLTFSLGCVYGTIELGAMIHAIAQSNSSYTMSAKLFVVAGSMFLCLVVLSVIVLWFRCRSYYHRYNKQWVNKDFGNATRFVMIAVTNSIAVSVTLHQAFMLLGRVLAEPCVADASIFELQGCNPEAAVHRIPQEQLLIMCLCVVECQLVFKDASQWSIAASWVIIVFSMNVALSIVDSPLAQYVNLNILVGMLLIISYEHERNTLCGFISSELNEVASAKVDNAYHSITRHIVHEIRGPLNTAVVGTDVLKHDLSEMQSIIGEEKFKKVMNVLDGIYTSIKCAGNYTNELLTYEKLAAGMTKLECAPTSLVDFVQSTLQPFYIVATSKDISFQLHITLPLTTRCSIDPVRMGQVLSNFLSNAMKFTPSGGNVAVSLGFDATELDFAIIRVRDSGVGMSAEDLEQLFQEGIQFSPNTNQKGGGSGFGLFIAKGLAELHEGVTIHGASDGYNLGSTFSIRLPLLAPSDDLNGGNAATSDLIRPPTALPLSINSRNSSSSSSLHLLEIISPLTVLVVDDSLSNRKMIGYLLERLGHIVVEAEDGVEAVAEIMRSMRNKTDSSYVQFDCVLMDYNMPKMNGLEAFKELKRLKYKGQVVGITADDLDMKEFITEGANYILQKPFDKSDLMKVVHSIKSQRDNESLNISTPPLVNPSVISMKNDDSNSECDSDCLSTFTTAAGSLNSPFNIHNSQSGRKATNPVTVNENVTSNQNDAMTAATATYTTPDVTATTTAAATATVNFESSLPPNTWTQYFSIIINKFITWLRQIVPFHTAQSATKSELTFSEKRIKLTSRDKQLVLQLSNSAHDMKSPCLAIGLLLEQQEQALVTIRDGTAASLRHCLSLVQQSHTNVNLMVMSVNRSLDFGKIAFGFPLKSKPEAVDAVAVVKKAVSMFAFDDEEGCIQIAKIDDNIPILGTTDPLWFKDNVLCIFNNAAKFSPKLCDVTVNLTYDSITQELEVLVQDSAPINLTVSQLKRLFDCPQICADSDFSHVGGMGLGMYCLAERVKVLGGKYGASTRLDTMPGTIVWFRIPFQADTSSSKYQLVSRSSFSGDAIDLTRQNNSTSTDMVKSTNISPKINHTISADEKNNIITNTATATATDTTPADELLFTDEIISTLSLTQHEAQTSQDLLKNMKVLVVDDAISILKVVSQMCRKSGAEVTQAKNGRQAFDCCKTEQFDLIIMDVQMPILGGCEAAKLMRAYEAESKRKASFILGISANAERENVIAAGMDCFIPKPFTWSELSQHLQQTTSLFNNK